MGHCQIFDRCPDTMNASTSSIHKSLSPHIEQASANDSVRVLKLIIDSESSKRGYATGLLREKVTLQDMLDC